MGLSPSLFSATACKMLRDLSFPAFQTLFHRWVRKGKQSPAPPTPVEVVEEGVAETSPEVDVRLLRLPQQSSDATKASARLVHSDCSRSAPRRLSCSSQSRPCARPDPLPAPPSEGSAAGPIEDSEDSRSVTISDGDTSSEAAPGASGSAAGWRTSLPYRGRASRGHAPAADAGGSSAAHGCAPTRAAPSDGRRHAGGEGVSQGSGAHRKIREARHAGATQVPASSSARATTGQERAHAGRNARHRASSAQPGWPRAREAAPPLTPSDGAVPVLRQPANAYPRDARSAGAVPARQAAQTMQGQAPPAHAWPSPWEPARLARQGASAPASTLEETSPLLTHPPPQSTNRAGGPFWPEAADYGQAGWSVRSSSRPPSRPPSRVTTPAPAGDVSQLRPVSAGRTSPGTAAMRSFVSSQGPSPPPPRATTPPSSAGWATAPPQIAPAQRPAPTAAASVVASASGADRPPVVTSRRWLRDSQRSQPGELPSNAAPLELVGDADDLPAAKAPSDDEEELIDSFIQASSAAGMPWPPPARASRPNRRPLPASSTVGNGSSGLRTPGTTTVQRDAGLRQQSSVQQWGHSSRATSTFGPMMFGAFTGGCSSRFHPLCDPHGTSAITRTSLLPANEL